MSENERDKRRENQDKNGRQKETLIDLEKKRQQPEKEESERRREKKIGMHIVYLDGVDTKIMTKLRKFIMENPPKIQLHKTRLLLTYCCRQDNLFENASLSRNYDKICFFLLNYVLKRCSTPVR